MHRNLNYQVMVFSVLFMALVIGGCSMLKEKPLPERVNDMYLVITAVSEEVVTDIKFGIYTKEEMRPIVNDLTDAKENLDAVDALTNQGKISEAKVKFELADRALSGARRLLADKRKTKAK